MLQFLSCLLALAVTCSARSMRLADRSCNNSPLLCSAAYDQVTHLGAHDSPFVRDASTGFSSFGNQYFNTTVQLDAGIRLLTVQVHVSMNAEGRNRELHLCHSLCSLSDAGPLHKWLSEVGRWLDRNPSEVVTLVLVNIHGVEARELEGEYAFADIAHYGYVPSVIDKAPPLSSEHNDTWPTLEELIDTGTRLITFVNPLAPDKDNAPYLLNQYDFVWENKYDVTDASAFACTPDRPSNTTTINQIRESGKLFMMNHFLYWQQAFGIQTPDTRNINDTNPWDGRGGLGSHMLQCSKEVSRQPTFVLVDFFSVGPAMTSVDIMNGVQQPAGRKAVGTAVMDDLQSMKPSKGSMRKRQPLVAAQIMAIVALIAIIVA